jgi:hypothetical protein
MKKFYRITQQDAFLEDWEVTINRYYILVTLIYNHLYSINSQSVFKDKNIFTKQVGQAVLILAICTGFSWFFLGKCLDRLKLDHCHFLPNNHSRVIVPVTSVLSRY